MKRVYYNKDYMAVSDVEVNKLAEQLLEQDTISTSNYLVIIAVKVLIHNRKLNYEEVEIYYYDKCFKPDKYGRFFELNCPEWDVVENLLMELI